MGEGTSRTAVFSFSGLLTSHNLSSTHLVSPTALFVERGTYTCDTVRRAGVPAPRHGTAISAEGFEPPRNTRLPANVRPGLRTPGADHGTHKNHLASIVTRFATREMDHTGIEPVLPACHAGVLPLYEWPENCIMKLGT